tara:strand:- start:592 stop:1191 length:600 start_codon:yes stop_codon:yes gene_type:complete
MNTALRFNIITPKLHRTRRLKRTSSNKEDTYLDTSNDKPGTIFIRTKKIEAPISITESYEKDDTVIKKFEENFLSVFKNAESIEKINGRVAQVGWSVALYYELSKQESLWNQVFNTRTFTLSDGVTDTVTYPSGGFFIIPLLSILILSASLAPKVNGGDDNKEFGPFTKRAELINGRGAMVGLLALSIIEHLNGGIALF